MWTRFKSQLSSSPPMAPDPPVQMEPSCRPDPAGEKSGDITTAPAPYSVEDGDMKDYMPNPDAQEGVRAAEAITLTWTKGNLVSAYICMWLIYLVNAFQSSITSNLSPFIVSGFELHSLVTTIGIVSSVMSGAAYFPVAKLMDVWGRSETFLLMMAFSTLGLILSAACTNISIYCAAQAFYAVGFVGMIFCVDNITASTSKLRNRGLAFAFTSSPYMISAFAGPKASESFYEQISWRWAYGTFAIILPVVAMPLFLTLQISRRRAEKRGLLIKEKSGRSLGQSIIYYLIEFDALGVFLLAAGLVLFLLPFNLADAAPNGWKTSYIIGMLVGGFATLVLFGGHEAYTAKKPFIPYNLLTDRTITGSLLISFTWQISYYCWNSYFSSFLQVVNGLTIAQAGYVGGIYDVVGGAWLLLVGYGMKRTGRFKWPLYFAVPLYLLANGLMIYFRRPNQSVGYLVMCEIFIAFAGSTITLVEQVAVMAAVDHQHVAAVLALLGLSGYTGGAVGNAISGAIWTNTFPTALMDLLPIDALENFDAIYGDLTTQLSYDAGSDARIAIQQAYGIAQKRMLIAGEVVMALTILWVLLIRNINIAEKTQMKGLLF